MKTPDGYEVLQVESDLSLVILQKDDLQYYFKQIQFNEVNGKLRTDFTINVASKDTISDVEYIQATEAASKILKKFLEDYVIAPATAESRPTTIVMPSQKDIDKVNSTKNNGNASERGTFMKAEKSKNSSSKFQKI